MRLVPLIVLAALSAVMLLAGMSFESSRADRTSWTRSEELLFPDLDAEATTVLVIESAEGTTTVALEGDTWTVTERAGYPARTDEVRRLVTALKTALFLEPKTAEPERYEKLGLEGTDGDASPTVRLTARAGDRVLADVFIGNRRFRGTTEGWFVRLPDEKVTWAVEGKLRVPKRTTEWLDSELMEVAGERVVRVEVDHGDDQPIVLSRSNGQANLAIENLPEGRKSKTTNPGGGMVRALAKLRIEDVAAASDLALGEPRTTTTWTTSDGLVVTCELWDQPGEEADLLVTRARFSFAIDEASAPPATVGPQLEDENTPPRTDPRQLLEEEVRNLSETTGGWIYTLQSWTTSNFSTTWDDLLEEVEEDETDEDEREGDAAPAPVEVPTVDPDEETAGEESSGEESSGEEAGEGEQGTSGAGGGLPD